MTFKNTKMVKKVAAKPCEWCGWAAGRRYAAHIIDEVKRGGKGHCNVLSLCPDCSTVFDEVIRPKLYKALAQYGATKLPESWRKNNKTGTKG